MVDEYIYKENRIRWGNSLISAVYVLKLLLFLIYKTNIAILISDGLLLLVLSWLLDRNNKLLLAYAACPMVIACYINNNLQLLFTLLLTLSVLFLFEKRLLIFGILLLAVTLYFNPILLGIVPLFLWFVIKKWQGAGIALAAVMCFYTIFVFHNMDITGLYMNWFIKSGNLYLFIPVLILSLLYLVMLNLTSADTELLFNYFLLFLGFNIILSSSFTDHVILTVPILFLYFYRRYRNRTKDFMIFEVCSVLYFFLETAASDTNELLPTILFAAFIYLLFEVFINGILDSPFYMRKNRAFTIGIAGNSGSGKSTLLRCIKNCIHNPMMELEGDGDHKWARKSENWKRFTQLNPQANYLYRQAYLLEKAKNRLPILYADYNHETGTFNPPRKYLSHKYIILSGLHALFLPKTRKNLDFKIFLETDEELRKYWKCKRDIETRGYSKETILKQLKDRESDEKEYIEPQKAYADFIIHYYCKFIDGDFFKDLNELLCLKLKFNDNIGIDLLLQTFEEYGIPLKYTIDAQTHQHILDFDGVMLNKIKIPFDKMFKKFYQNEFDQFTNVNLNNYCTNIEGMVQLFILIMIYHKYKEIY